MGESLMGLRQGRSPFGAFIRSPFGARGLASLSLSASSDGIATTLLKYFSPKTLSSFINCATTYQDGSYPSNPGTVNQGLITGISLGKASVGSNIRRGRAGISFALAGLSGATSAVLKLQCSSFASNWGETWNPRVYASTTDDSGLYATSGTKTGWNWELNTNTFIADMIEGNTTVRSLTVPIALINAAIAAGHNNFCFIVGEDLELSGTGNTTPSGSLQSTFVLSGSGSLVMT